MPSRLLVIITLAAVAAAPLRAAQQAPAAPSPAPTPQAEPARPGEPNDPPGATARAGGVPPRTTAPRGGGAPVIGADYRLAIGDKLRVEVYKDAQLSQSLQIRPDGKITLPLVGDVTAAGLTSLELRDQLATALREYVTNPVVTVIVVESVPPVVYVMGEVNTPGAIPLNNPLSVLQALAMAGGFREFANTKDIKVLRRTPRGVQTIAFNYKTAVRGDGNQTFMLQPGDTIIVP
jgi:polysaccharide export outer membrane protein